MMSQKSCALNKQYCVGPSYSAKEINRNFQKYRSSFLPDVIESWG